METPAPNRFQIEDAPESPMIPRWVFGAVFGLLLVIVLRYAIPQAIFEAGHNWEAGRAKAAAEALERLDEKGILSQSSAIFRLAAQRTGPSVVHVETAGPHRIGQWTLTSGLGSGFVINKAQGWIVTNAHVVRESTEIRVRIPGGKELKARLVGADPKTDLAVLQTVEALPSEAVWGDSEILEPGEWVLAIGNPFALDRTVTVGIVSATQRNDLGLVEGGYEDWIQTDAAINPGNSGGPLINLKGEVVGVNTAILSETGANQGVGLAIPAKMARGVVEQLIANGRVIRGYLGVELRPMTAEIAEALKSPDEPGMVAIVRVLPGGPAAKAGIQPGDVAAEIDGQPIQGVQDMRRRISGFKIGTKISLTIYREGVKQVVDAEVGELPQDARVGFNIRAATPAEAQLANLNPDQGAYVAQVEPGSAAHAAGLRPGMRIAAVNGSQVASKAQCEAILNQVLPGQRLVLRVRTPDERSIAFTVGR